MSQPFPSNNLKLSAVLQGYSVTDGSMSDLTGLTCYDSNGNVFISPAKGVNFPLLKTFGGKFAHPTNGSVSDPPIKSVRTDYGGGSVACNIGPKLISYSIIGNVLVKLSFAVSLRADGQGDSTDESTSGFEGSFQIDDGTTYTYPNIAVDPLSSVQTFSVSGTSKVVITLYGVAADAVLSGISATGVWTYNITPNGLVFVSGP